MASKFNTETMTTMRRLGKGMQKTTNISTSKKYGSTRINPEELRALQAKKYYNDRLPLPLRPKELAKQEPQKDEKVAEAKEENKDNIHTSQLNQNVEQSANQKKEETSFDYGANELEQSDDEHHKLDSEKQSKLEKDLDQIIYISIVETPTTIMFYSPSTKYLTIKNDEYKEEQTKKTENYKEYINKLKNKESFARKAAQTINRFKSNQLVSTSMTKDAETEMVDERINCLNYIISDAVFDKKAKNDDIWLQNQKLLDKKVKKELKAKLKRSTELLTVDSSSRSVQKSEVNESASFMDTVLSSSMHSSRRTKVQKSGMGVSQDKSNLIDKKSSPNSSMMKNSTNSEHQTIKGEKEPNVNIQQVKRALNEELPKTLSNPLKYVERLLSQNKYHFMQIAYKDYPVNKSEFEVKTKEKEQNVISALGGGEAEKENDKDTLNMQKDLELIRNDTDEPVIKKLLTYSIDGLLASRNIAAKYICYAMDWNKNNEDLLAAVYGDPDINSKSPGFLCFWTLKNPLHPERVIETPRGLTYCNFSKKNPYLIVVSDFMGEIMIYDLRTNSDKPIADSSEVKDKHTDIVWECKWIERPNDKNEIIVTTSSDGKMKEWSLKKGLEVTDLLMMKKTTSFPMKHLNPFAKYLKKDRGDMNSKDGKEIKDTLIFREANGLSFDFPKNDTSIYYVALEECTIHRCRTSYKDQYTDNYYGHQGPVYKIRCNPFDPNILISCSYDWTVKIWNSKHNYPVMNLHTNELNHQVNDIEWSGDTSTIFGDVADDGRIEIWDLARKAIQPIIIMDENTTPKKSIKFSLGGKVVATGDADGKIDVFRLYNLEHSPVSEEHQRDHLKNVIEQNSDINNKI